MTPEPVVIIPYQDGPYLVRGPVVLRDQEGRSITVNRRTVALCRCGKSRMRPFCDGTHHVIRFRAASAAEQPRATGRGGARQTGGDRTEPGQPGTEPDDNGTRPGGDDL